ncbi:tRNA 2-thiouridine(34) synthase MnmA [Bacteriovorax stolpii]|uniref:tRNA-specific 2-thiouridylase MnmA n=1 Tax=Bacteriovorax stolpii TaxID=960 RepID=A0A2K9NRT9_BACTC|nr:tRNA 2-thiouridine(34) synthase MnmA [Bacteriovorax stolpii]AUN98233.1 tRNA 2-thiouridine(34) synthase MnmA [Bacteriovorax stolpii]QDK41786.1 tRNA 2-thiouridine(34) synthase MnmA [Bacteriovorax stolpii]TDP52153.1 tRNA (5-methylaminomethyl-2-thiouridylate)-methyltransferase [Bacteriovorax stolpii]
MNKPKSETLVIVGMSGGVDSSVSAALLKEEGYNVVGLFMKNWEEFDEHGVCQSSKEYADVVKVCEKLDIPYYSVDFIKEYKEQVFSHFVEEYKMGFTPNPDILCNREIKFKVFFEKAMELGADFLATGHYCQSLMVDGQQRLVKGADPLKDQSYFLYTIKKEILEKVLFPIGHIPKTEVRRIAAKYDLATKEKKDSTGICFIGERNFKNFLSNYVTFEDGNFETLDGTIVGRHTGATYYTLGQRKGLGLGGQGEPWFVVGKDMKRNVVIVERGDHHPHMYADTLTATDLSFVGGAWDRPLPFKCTAKVRYRQKDQACTVTKIEGDKIYVEFDEAQRAITPRQSVVFYDGDVCLGGAMIEASGPSYYEMKRPLASLEVTSTSDH